MYRVHCAMPLQTRVSTFIYIIIIDDENYYCRYPILLLYIRFVAFRIYYKLYCALYRPRRHIARLYDYTRHCRWYTIGKGSIIGIYPYNILLLLFQVSRPRLVCKQ